MPLMNGPELAKRVKSARNEITVLYMSGYTDDTPGVFTAWRSRM